MANPENEIPTDAATRLEQLLSQRRGGSIGVSGPRGIGKSTLIAAICRRPIEGRTWRISVQVAAPVEYAPLEFVLYLFAKVCEKAVPQVVPPQRADTRTHSDAGRRLAIVLAAMAAVGAGSAAVLVFTAWLAGLLSTSEERRLSTAIVATGLATTVAVGVLVTRATSTSFDDRYTRSPMIPSLADYASWVRLEYSRTLDRPFAPSLGLLAAAILAAVAIALFVFGSPTNGVDDTTLVGVGLVAAGGFTAVVAEVSRAWPKRRLYEFQFEADGGRMPNEWRIQFPIIVANGMAFIAVVFLASGVLPLVLAAAARPEPIELARASVFAGLAAVLVRAVFQLTRDRRRDGPQRSPFPDSMLLGGSLEGEALNLLEAIHFQQTLTTGSTAKVSLDSVLGFPFSAEASTSASRALSARAWSLPEAIDRFNGFVERAGAEGSVIIGIDELDKMSHENAEKFLNQIKAIFVTANTHFLVSVSEDAVADFERRGLPFRDVFDSSFDDVVVLRYLNLAETYLLLSRRVIGLPIAFAALCYCLSGGLPRDVLRSARRLFEVRATSGDTRLSQLSSALLADEFLGKQAATAVAMRRDQGPNLAPALDWLGRLRVEDATEAGIVANANPALMPTGSAIGTSAGNDVRDLVDEFVGYWYFCATLRDVFGSSLDYARLISAERAAVSGGTFDELARARQDFAVSTGVAWERISAFRRSWGLKAIDRTPTGSSLASPA